MAAINDLDLVLHNIRVKLYPNYLANVKGAYIARTDNDKTLTIEDIVTTIVTRGGFVGNYDELLDDVRQFISEVIYQLLDGYRVSLGGFFTMHLNVGGSFNSVHETHDHKKHPISVSFSTLRKLRLLLAKLNVGVGSIAEDTAFIDEFIDTEENSANGTFSPGNMFILHGEKIKIEGTDPSCGLYFVPVDDPSKAVKVARISENNPSKITGICPTTEHMENRLEIRTQFAGNATLLKAPRIIVSRFIIEEV